MVFTFGWDPVHWMILVESELSVLPLVHAKQHWTLKLIKWFLKSLLFLPWAKFYTLCFVSFSSHVWSGHFLYFSFILLWVFLSFFIGFGVFMKEKKAARQWNQTKWKKSFLAEFLQLFLCGCCGIAFPAWWKRGSTWSASGNFWMEMCEGKAKRMKWLGERPFRWWSDSVHPAAANFSLLASLLAVLVVMEIIVGHQS